MKKKILVIEDEPIIAEMICILLEIEGYKVISLSDEESIKDELNHKQVDLVLLDLNLVGYNGASICEYIKNNSDLKHIPVILVSANHNIEKIKEECGADDLIKKPFELTYFLQKIRSYTEAMV
jgi:DNA-binding response OmpR family regulator